MPKQYEDVRRLLATSKLDGLCGAGATEQDIREGERDLGVRLPVSYRKFLNEYGWGYFGPLELIVGLGSDIPEEWRRGADVRYVVADERNGPSQFPTEIIPFCQNGAGDWYALDCSERHGEEAPVVFVAHEAIPTILAREKCADSFADWIFVKLSGRPGKVDKSK